MGFHGFYLTTEKCFGDAVCPSGWSGDVEKNIPIVLIYFDQSGMEFMDGNGNEFRLHRKTQEEYDNGERIPIIEAASCSYCGKIVPTKDLEEHTKIDDNCKNARRLKEGI